MTPAQLAQKLRQLEQLVPEAVEGAMVEGALMLQGRLVQREIAAADPQPVDQGQYKGAWQMTQVPGGAVVGNSAKHAVFIERGRGPGPVPFGPILEWVKRKGIVRGRGRRADAEATRAALAIQRKIEQQGIEPKWILRRSLEALRAPLGRIIKAKLRAVKP